MTTHLRSSTECKLKFWTTIYKMVTMIFSHRCNLIIYLTGNKNKPLDINEVWGSHSYICLFSSKPCPCPDQAYLDILHFRSPLNLLQGHSLKETGQSVLAVIASKLNRVYANWDLGGILQDPSLYSKPQPFQTGPVWPNWDLDPMTHSGKRPRVEGKWARSLSDVCLKPGRNNTKWV